MSSLAGPAPLKMPAFVGLAVVAAAILVSAWGFGAAFPDNSYVLASVGGLVVGLGAAYVGYRLRLNLLLTALAGVTAFFLLGTPFTMPSEGVGFVLPSLRSLAGLALGSVQSWTDMVTLSTPLDAPYYLATGPFAATFLAALVAGSLVMRWVPKHVGSAWRKAVTLTPVYALFASTVLLGTFEPHTPMARGLALAILSMLWLSLRFPSNASAATQTRRAIIRYRLIGTGFVTAGAIAAGLLGAGFVEPADEERFVLREHVEPPFDPDEFPSPLSGFRRYTKDLNEDAMFRIDGLEPGDYVRLAVMDAYDGKLWSVSTSDGFGDASGAFELVGEHLPSSPFVDPAAGPLLDEDGVALPPRVISVTVLGYHDIWVPFVGLPEHLEFAEGMDDAGDLIYNRWTTSGVLLDGLSEGDSYTLTLAPHVLPTDQELQVARVAQLDQPTLSSVPSIVVAKAEEYATGSSTAIEELRSIESYLQDNGFLSHGTGSDAVPSLAGHGADRLTSLFEKSVLVGDEEQYAAAFAIMARELGYPARVVFGFKPEIEVPTDGVVLTGENISAWVEVAFEDVGWVPFFPTPDETDVPRDEEPQPKAEPQPQVRQPPREEDQQDQVASPVQIEEPEEDDEEEEEEEQGLPGWFWPAVIALVVPILLYLIPVIIVALLKGARRSRRRNRGDDHRRAAAAWDEVEDAYAELGYEIEPRLTRVERALDFEDQLEVEIAARAGERAALERREQEKAEARLAKLEEKQDSADVRSPMLTVRAATIVRSKHTEDWHPGVAGKGDDAAPLPELRTIAVDADRAVFAGESVESDELDRLWAEVASAIAAGRKSVTWTRRQLSRFRFRVRGARA